MKNELDCPLRDRKALKNGVTAVDMLKENIKPNGFFLTHTNSTSCYHPVCLPYQKAENLGTYVAHRSLLATAKARKIP
ncbi:hypothetical protein HMPREF2955_12475 [Prevotella sp. HMSC073D09]|uniref:hypothetical protein n=1 Tax=Prevotella sp. HMSC073D09 TaxID=1739459 RepID=UPI0008D00CA9|nr:hypothetical protein [Prevotella sp. HMSC073D09]OFQ14529.1 hypothetical protein HMPREF2955_12475 [Prevotella sp. HMSC073D09]